VTAFFCNPNITDEEEYRLRLRELVRLANAFGAEVIDGGYASEAFFEAVKGLEHLPERGARCAVCFKLRLERTAAAAVGESGLDRAKTVGTERFDIFATTLTLSPLKDAALINSAGADAAQRYGTEYLPSDFKKRDGNRRSAELCKQFGLYRQNYCGCVFSK
jgi:predicted adenine nucleotide alpha hydrolase (AANH) superfamily ATPase